MTKPTQTSMISQFTYQPERIHVGTLYHYEKANLDDSNPAQICIYVASENKVEVVKVETGSHLLAYVTARMDWSIFSAVQADSWHILPDGTLREQAKSGFVGRWTYICCASWRSTISNKHHSFSLS